MRKLLLRLLPVLLASFSCYSQTTSLAGTDANSIVAASTINSGLGTTSPSDVVLTGTLIRHAGNDEQGTITLAANSSGATKVDMNLPAGHIIETNNGNPEPPTCGWTSQDGVIHKSPINNCISAAPWFFPLISLRPAFAASVDTGQNNSDAKTASVKAWRVPASSQAAPLFQKLSETTFELDPVSLLPKSMKFYVHPEDAADMDLLIEVRYSDYRDVNGIKVPFRIEKYLGETLLLEITLDSASFNTGQAIP